MALKLHEEKKAKKASKQRPRRERGGGGEGPNVFQFLTTCMVQATTKDGAGRRHGVVVADVAALLPSFATFFCFTEGQKLKTMKTTPLLVAVSCKALPMAKATEGCPPAFAHRPRCCVLQQ